MLHMCEGKQAVFFKQIQICHCCQSKQMPSTDQIPTLCEPT